MARRKKIMKVAAARAKNIMKYLEISMAAVAGLSCAMAVAGLWTACLESSVGSAWLASGLSWLAGVAAVAYHGWREEEGGEDSL